MTVLRLQQLSISMEDGKVLRWLVADGDRVAQGDIVVEVETDKATVEVESPADGTIAIVASEGTVVPVDGVLGEVRRGGGTALPGPSIADRPNRHRAAGTPTTDAAEADRLTGRPPACRRARGGARRHRRKWTRRQDRRARPARRRSCQGRQQPSPEGGRPAGGRCAQHHCELAADPARPDRGRARGRRTPRRAREASPAPRRR